MRILFLEFDTDEVWAVASLGPASIAAYLRQHGHEVGLIRVRHDAPETGVVSQVRAAEPDLIGVSLTTRQWPRARALVPAVKGATDAPVIAGGMHATFSPDAVLTSPGFDYVCLGEGEEASLELVTALERGGDTRSISNIWKRGAARPPVRRPFPALDDLPFMSRDMLDEYEGCVHMTTQRGCPFRCTYCGARMFNELYRGIGEYCRRRSPRHVLDELLAIRRAGPLNYVIYLDDTFTINHSWVVAFCSAYAEQVHVPFSLHARVDTVNRPILDALATAGCRQITYGVESGSYRIRKNVMRRPVTNQQIKDAFLWTREAGIAVTANYMLGLPDETRDDLQQTLDLAEELEPLDFGYFVFYPYPGTHLFHYCREKGYLPENHLDAGADHRTSILDLPTLERSDIAEYYERFTELRRRLSKRRIGPQS